jgi:Leucine-rich repeat (LRR) protein
MSNSKINTYLNSLSDDVRVIDISYRNIRCFPDLTRFKNLKELNCDGNKLTSLPALPQNLKALYCSNNLLTCLDNLPENLEVLYCYYNELISISYFPKKIKKLCCSDNKLTSLPALPKNIKELYCSTNKLTYLPSLPENLQVLYSSNNELTYLPSLPENLQELYCSNNKLTCFPRFPENLRLLDYGNNPIYEIIDENIITIVKYKINIINKFRFMYYCVKFKKQFRKWLWTKIREPKIIKKYHPKYLIEHLADENTDLDIVLNNWEL